jgi:hypothetical protein
LHFYLKIIIITGGGVIMGEGEGMIIIIERGVGAFFMKT